MITTLIKKEIIDNFKEGKIQILCIAIITLVFITTLINLDEYKKRNENYLNQISQNSKEIKENKVYATLELKALKPPEVLSIVCKGIENKVGNELVLNFNDLSIIPNKALNINEYTQGFYNLDVSTIFIWLISLIGFLLSYDCMSKEREEGTLSLLLTSSITKSSIIISKIISSIIVIVMIVLVSFISISLIFTTSSSISFNISLIKNLVVLMLIFILYGTFWVLIGSTSSIVSVSSATSLISSMAVWIFFIVILPGVLTLLLGDTMLLENKRNTSKAISDLDNSFYEDYNELFDKHIMPIIRAQQFGTSGGGIGSYPIWFPNEKTKEAMLYYFDDINEIRENYFENKIRVEEKGYLLPLVEKNRFSSIISIISPVNIIELVVQKVSSTSYESHYSFINQFLIFRKQIDNYLTSKDAYKSNLWFTPKADKYYKNVWNDPNLYLNLNNIPVFQYNRKSNISNMIINIVFPILAYLFLSFIITIVNITLIKKYKIK